MLSGSVQIVNQKAGAVAAVASRKPTLARRAAARKAASVSVNRSAPVFKRERSVRVNAGNDELKSKAQDLLTTAADKWEETEDKPTVVTLALAGLVTLIVTSSLLGALDKVPFLGGILELVGIGYSAYFAYNNLLFTPDREELTKKVDDIKSKIL